MAGSIPDQARVVIVGGGIVGCSIAYHLVKMGWQDVVLLERKKLTSGTTWHAAGLVGQLRPSQNMTKLAKYTAELYTHIEAETGQATGFKQNGSVTIATNLERFEELKRNASMAKVFNLDVDVISTDEVRERYPLINTDDVIGGTWIASDGQINPIDVTQALARGARSGGAQIFEDVKVTRIVHDGGRVTGVETEAGAIKADKVVLCAGMWTRELARQVGVPVPLHACEHYYLVTEPFAGVEPDLPVFRDYDACAYYKEDAGKILLGAFEPVAKPWGGDGIPESFCFDELPGDFDHFQPVLEKAMKRMPALEHAGIQTFFCGPESFTPDDRYHLGESAELDNLFVASGFNSIGIQSAGGVGKVLSEWMRDGHPPADLWEVDVRRNIAFLALQRVWDCSTPCTGRIVSSRLPGGSDIRRFMTGMLHKMPVLVKWQDGSGLTGTHRKVKPRNTNTPGFGRTGLTIPPMSTRRSVKMWGCWTRPLLPSFWSRVKMQPGYWVSSAPMILT